jgi:hypothetical protein
MQRLAIVQLNLTTGEQIGLTIPPAVRYRANKVITKSGGFETRPYAFCVFYAFCD